MKKKLPIGHSFYAVSMPKIKNVIFFFLAFFIHFNSWSQNNDTILSNAALAEKIYLQLDRKTYTNEDTIWFKCILSNAFDHIPSHLSGVLYVELIGPNEMIRQQKLVKIKNGIGHNYFDLDKNIKGGTYLIRAYTKWNENFEKDFLFKEYIQVFTNDYQEEPISNIKLIKEQSKKNYLQVTFNPTVIDTLHKKKLTVYINVDDKTDTLFIKKDSSNKYHLNYNITDKNQFATFKILTKNNKKYTKTFALDKNYIDLQFFPESGEMVHSLDSKIGFKATDANGKGKFTEGFILNDKDSIITSFTSNELGMGSFIIRKTDSTQNYFARLKHHHLQNEKLLYPLPKVASLGNNLAINRIGKNIFINASSNYILNDSIFISFSFRGINLYKKRVKLNKGKAKLLIPHNGLPEGIISFTMSDHLDQPVARRLFFNEKHDKRIKINLTTNQKKYHKRELTKLKIQTTNAKEESVKTNLSVLVINKKELGTIQSIRQNILSYFLLDSELKGHIENPGFYFSENKSMHYHLEALMLTQGWSKYNYSKPYKSVKIQPEPSLTLSGKVNHIFSSKKGMKDIEVTMMTSGKEKSLYKQLTDSLGQFKFHLNDEYGDDMEILVQTSKKLKNKNYPLELDIKETPLISFLHEKPIKSIDSIIEVFVEKSIEKKETQKKFEMQYGSVLLEEVDITAYKMTPNRKKVADRYGKPNTVIDGKEILAKEKEWSYGLYSVLLFNFPDKVRIEQTPEQYLYATVNNMPTLVVIDGIPVTFHDYSLIPNIPPSEVSSFEIIEFANNFSRLYCDVHNEIASCEIGAPIWGNVIAIYTHAKKGIFGAVKPKGVTKNTISVFSEPSEFYSPKYDSINENDWQKPDLRSLIHWQPVLNTNELGEVSSSFYNADKSGEMMIVIEAINDKGEIGYQEFTYTVN